MINTVEVYKCAKCGKLHEKTSKDFVLINGNICYGDETVFAEEGIYCKDCLKRKLELFTVYREKQNRSNMCGY